MKLDFISLVYGIEAVNKIDKLG